MMRCAIRSTVLVAVAALSVSCASSRKTWVEHDAGPIAFEDAWQAFEDVARSDGYIAGGGTDRGLRVFESRWRSLAMPFGKGYRKRVRAQFEPTEASGWRIRYHVELQEVDDLARRMDPEEDDWSAAGQDTATEQRIAHKLRYRLGTPVEMNDSPAR